MPWHLERREGRVCVIKDADGSTAGCHDSRADAVKQMRALYANESRMASLYSELDAQEETQELPAAVTPPPGVPSAQELVKVVVGSDNEALTASMLEQMERMAERQARTDEALVAALHAIGTRNPVVNVAAPDVRVEPPQVTVEAPSVSVEAPEVTVQAPEVTVRPEITVQSPAAAPVQKTITFERDPLTGSLSKAEVTEA